MKIKLDFLKPRLLNILLTVVIFFTTSPQRTSYTS